MNLLLQRGLRVGRRSERPEDSFAGRLRHQPWALLCITALLLLLSLFCVHSASYDAGLDRSLGYDHKQMRWIAIALFAYLVSHKLRYQQLLKLAPWIYALGIIALLLVPVLGTTVKGARRWFSFGSTRVQPSEFMKLALLLALARVIGDTGDGVRSLKGWLAPVLLTGLPFVLVAAQPDLGTALTFLPILLVALIVAGARVWHLSLIALSGAVAAPLMWTFVLHDYQKGRVLSFLDPAKAADGGAYQQIQSIIAVGSGGIWGKGYEAGTQGRLGFLPERHTDFIFAVIGEELGLVGTLSVLALYGLLLTALVFLAKRCPDRTGRLLIMGVGTVLFMQVTINVAMNIGCAPITGLTLPFISYGGSSMLSSFLGLALVAAAARQLRCY